MKTGLFGQQLTLMEELKAATFSYPFTEPRRGRRTLLM